VQEINYEEIKRDVGVMQIDLDFIKQKLLTKFSAAQPKVITIPAMSTKQRQAPSLDISNSMRAQGRIVPSTSPSSVQQQNSKVAENHLNSEETATDAANHSVGEEPVPETSDEEGLIPPDRLSQLFIKSCSRQNFAVNLVRELFTEDTRKVSNYSGKGKKKLDEKKMEYVKKTVFLYHCCLEKDKVEKWKECTIMIDEANRRLNNKPKKR